MAMYVLYRVLWPSGDGTVSPAGDSGSGHALTIFAFVAEF